MLTIGPSALRARWFWKPRSSGVVVILQTSTRLGPGGVALIHILRERSRSWLRLALRERGERALKSEPAEIKLLGERVLQGIAWLREQAYAAQPRIGLFGEGQGASVALRVAAMQPTPDAALVLCSGRIDFAGSDLASVQAPTLMIVAGLDQQVLTNNLQVLNQLRCPRRLEVIPDAMRNLAQPGAIDTAGHLAAGWFETHLRVAGRKA
jgi:putative phosphoribosyl transferase